MSVPPPSLVGRNPLRPILLPPGFDAFSKKAQQPWKTCLQLKQRAYPVEIYSPCQKKHRAEQAYVCQASITGHSLKKCVSCIVSHFPCNVAHNKICIVLVLLQLSQIDARQDVLLLIPIFSPYSPSPYTLVGLLSVPLSLLVAQTFLTIAQVFSLVGSVNLIVGLASVGSAGSPSGCALSKVGSLVVFLVIILICPL